LKDKLKECSQQLEEYEKERDNVIASLEKYGIPVSSILQLTTSASHHSASNFDDLDSDHHSSTSNGKKLLEPSLFYFLTVCPPFSPSLSLSPR
jgi:hypothetical protein